MNDEPMMIDETDDEPATPRATSSSWKKAQFIVAGLSSLFVVSLVMADDWGKTFGGATRAQVAEFELAMNDYFDEAQSRGLSRVAVDLFETDQSRVAYEQATGTAAALGYRNTTKARDMFTVLAVLHNDNTPPPLILTTEQVAEIDRQQGSAAAAPDFDWTTARPLEDDTPWVMRDIAAGIWTAFKAVAIPFVVVWLLLWLCELFWWFLMDRLHDVANAVRRR